MLYVASVGVWVVGAAKLCVPIVNTIRPVAGSYVPFVTSFLIRGVGPTLNVIVLSLLTMLFLKAETNVWVYWSSERAALPTSTVNAVSVTSDTFNHLLA